ncbi:sigma-54 interaction domain-containing protein [Bacteroidota bacterium]
MSEVQRIKQRFGIIGNSEKLNRAIDIAIQVAPTDLSVLIFGESGVGKEVFPQIIHQYSARKHNSYIAVNCGAIPEGTIDSELFGHEKGAFTGAHESRKGYFEVANHGTIFLDEISELPSPTQVRLLRVLESGEFIRVGSSKVIKTDVRIIAATNIDVVESVQKGKFREDLYYRLNTVPITIPSLRDRIEDIELLFRKFALDFADKYRMPAIHIDDEAKRILTNYEWPGNVRQLKNITEQISVIEQNREIDSETIKKYIPGYIENKLPAIYNGLVEDRSFASEREILYKILFDMRNDVNDMKKLVLEMLEKEPGKIKIEEENAHLIKKLYKTTDSHIDHFESQKTVPYENENKNPQIQDTEEFIEESLSLVEKEKELIVKALQKHNGKRKYAANELGISERTLYRKLKEYDIDE